jgi:hypothetical protein
MIVLLSKIKARFTFTIILAGTIQQGPLGRWELTYRFAKAPCVGRSSAYRHKQATPLQA